MAGKISYGIFRVARKLVEWCSPKMQVYGQEHLPQEPALVVANHSQMYGPISCELYFPEKRYIWCAGQMMHLKEVPAYAYADFWSYKPKYIRWLYKILSYLIAPLSVCVFNNAKTIGVYRDARVIATFKNTVSKLQQGANVVVFPEYAKPYNGILCEFQDKFIDIARLYYKKTGKALSFVPMYIAPECKGMYLAEPIRYDPEIPVEQQRQQICEYLKKAITDMACALPPHRVVPYMNVTKKEYPMNIAQEVAEREKAGC